MAAIAFAQTFAEKNVQFAQCKKDNCNTAVCNNL